MLRLNLFIVKMLEALKLSLNDIIVHGWFCRVLLRILVVGERCNVTGEYFKRGSTSEYKTVIGYQMFAGELCIVNGEFSNLWCLMNTLWFCSLYHSLVTGDEHGIDKQNVINYILLIITVESPASAHPKCKDLVVPYRW